MEKTITADELQDIVGPLDDAVISAVIATGATVKEVSEAFAWLTMDDSLAKDLRHACQGRVAVVCDLLADVIEPAEEPARSPKI